MPRSTSDRWKQAMEQDSTAEQPVSLITITTPEDDANYIFRAVNDNDYFARKAVGVSTVAAIMEFDPVTLQIHDRDGIGFFDPQTEPEIGLMKRLAFFNLGAPTPQGDGPHQIKTIIDVDTVEIFPRKDVSGWVPALNCTCTYMETFSPYGMSVKLPDEQDNEVPTVDFTINKNDPASVNMLASLTKPPLIVAEVALRSEPDWVQMSTPPLEWSSIVFNRNAITGSVSGPSALNMQVPVDSRTPFLRPGLFDIL